MTNNSQATILIVNNIPKNLGLLFEALHHQEYKVLTAEDGPTAITLAKQTTPDLILLDIGLPGMDGLDALRNFQQQADTPIIFVTARRRELDQALGLELGADDYITKPFDVNVLLARVKAVLRRYDKAGPAATPSQERLEVGDLTIEASSHVATLNGEPLELAPREFALLHALALNPGQVMSVESLLAQVWGAEYSGESQVVYVHIRWLREKIETDPKYPKRIVTVRGVGYKLEPGA